MFGKIIDTVVGRFTSIRHKLVLVIILFNVTLLLVIAGATYTYFRQTTQQWIFEQQFSMLTGIAHGLDDKITSAHRTLISEARVAPGDIVSSRRTAQSWLDNRTGTRTIFGHGLLILDSYGVLVASSPPSPARYGVPYLSREQFSQLSKNGRPHISLPFMETDSGPMVFMMTAPLRTADGSLRGFLCGTIDLQDKHDFFEVLRNTSYGSTGYLYLFAADRTLIAHPDISRILKKDVKPGANRLFDKALEGFEGSGETINSKGLQVLASFKRLQSTGWILAANYPVAEAYRPMVTFRIYYFIGMFAALLICVALAFWLSSGITRPLTNLTTQIRALSVSGADRRQRLESTSRDELGLLATSFNLLLEAGQRDAQELNRREKHFRQMFENHSAIMLMIEPGSGRIVDANHAAEQFYGYPVARLRKMLISEINQLSGDELALRREHASTGTERVFIFPHRLSDGSVRTVEVHATPIGDAGDTLLYSIIHDITDRKQAEEELKRRTMQLEDLTQNLGQKVAEETELRRTGEAILFQQAKMAAMGEMLGAISHQWRQPLNALGLIVQNIGTAYDYGELDQVSIEKAISKAMSQIKHMSRTIDDFRSFFKPDKRAVTFDAAEAVGQVLLLLSAQLEANDIDFRLTCHTHQKSFHTVSEIAVCQEKTVRGHKNEFEHVILNLIQNARDAIVERRRQDRNFSRGTLSIDFYYEDGIVVLEVSDNGGGIAPDVIDRIFEPYFTSKEAAQGTGVGLYMSKVILERMHGKLRAENSTQGAVFTITLPGAIQTLCLPPEAADYCSART